MQFKIIEKVMQFFSKNVEAVCISSEALCGIYYTS